MRTFLRWLTDWRTGAIVIASALVAYLGVLVVTGIEDRARAIDAAKTATDAAQATAERASRRISQLLDAQAQLERDAKGNAIEIAELKQEIAVLIAQLRSAGVQPVILAPSGDQHTRPSPSPTRTSGPSPRPTATHSPSPSPSPSKSCTTVQVDHIVCV